MITVLSGPTGVGKTTIAETIGFLKPDIHRPVSCTTRAPKNGEQNSIDYHFLSREVFERRIEAGMFAEWAKVDGNYYGTLNIDLKGRSEILLEIDVQGMRQIAAQHQVRTIFVLPKSFDVLEARLRDRKRGESEEEIAQRLERAKMEIACAGEYHYQVVNDELRVAVRQILDLMNLSPVAA